MTKDPNENRPGYKKTKVGWLPDEWKSVRLMEVVNPKRPICYGVVQTGEPIENGIPCVRVMDLVQGCIDTARMIKTSEKIHATYKRTQLVADDVIVALRGDVGKSMIVPNSLEGINLTRGVALLSKSKSVIPKYLENVLAGPQTRYFFYLSTNGTALQEIPIDALKKIPIPLPPLLEQNKIAEILSTWDDAIEQTRKLLEAKKCLKKALVQQLLTGKKRSSGFVKSPEYVKHRFFDIPMDWEYLKIAEIAKECSERNKSAEQITVLSCSKHKGFVESAQYFAKQVFSEDTSNYKVIKKGWFGYPSNHIEEGSIGLLLTHDIGIVSPIYTIFKTTRKALPEYLYSLFKTETFRYIFQANTNASVDRRGSLRWNEFSLLHVPVPSQEEQRYIIDVLSEADCEIKNLECKLAALEKQKRGLMQKLLTGQVRVKVKT